MYKYLFCFKSIWVVFFEGHNDMSLLSCKLLRYQFRENTLGKSIGLVIRFLNLLFRYPTRELICRQISTSISNIWLNKVELELELKRARYTHDGTVWITRYTFFDQWLFWKLKTTFAFSRVGRVGGTTIIDSKDVGLNPGCLEFLFEKNMCIRTC